MVSCDESVVGNHGVNIVPLGVNHGVLIRVSGCESLCAMLSQ